MTRKVLQYASIIGMEFSLGDILDLARDILNMDVEDIQDRNIIGRALRSAVNEGVLHEIVEDEDTIGDSIHTLTQYFIGLDDVNTNSCGEDEFIFGEVRYSFFHDSWRRVIVSLMLDSYVQDIHRHAALAIENRTAGTDIQDYRTKIEVFRHWKGSGDTINAGKEALAIGLFFKNLGMNSHSIRLYEESIAMWKIHDPPEGEEIVAGFSPLVLDALDEANLVTLVKLQTALGQAIGSVYSGDLSPSALAFKNALDVSKTKILFVKHCILDSNIDCLQIIQFAPVSVEVKDRAFMFPIYSGMFFLLKYGALCEPSEEVETELELVSKFVRETEIHGDPVHYGRALAMQGETYHRLGRFESAISSHMKLKEVYDVDKHSALVVASYASDRCAQNFGCTANCCMRLGQVDKALAIADHIEYNIMPKMDPKNVHNSAVMVFPIIWILKDNGMVERSRKILEKFVQKPFDEYFGEDGSTPFLPAFKPFKILLEIASVMQGEMESFEDEYLDWAVDLTNMKMNSHTDAGVGFFGRGPMSASAETCLRLSKLTKDPKKKKKYLENCSELAQLTMSGCDGTGGSAINYTALAQIKPVFDELQEVLKEEGRGLA